MARYFRLTCGECDYAVTSHKKEPRYDHLAAVLGKRKFDHEVTEVLSEDISPASQ
jgi:hypothetical protein